MGKVTALPVFDLDQEVAAPEPAPEPDEGVAACGGLSTAVQAVAVLVLNPDEGAAARGG